MSVVNTNCYKVPMFRKYDCIRNLRFSQRLRCSCRPYPSTLVKKAMPNGIPNSILAKNEAEVWNIKIENNLHNTHSVLVYEKEVYVFEQAKKQPSFFVWCIECMIVDDTYVFQRSFRCCYPPYPSALVKNWWQKQYRTVY